MTVTAAGLTGAEGTKLWPSATVSQSAPLTVLTLVTLRTGALLHPAGWKSRTLPGCHQGDVVKITGTCRGKRAELLRVVAVAWKRPVTLTMSFPVTRTSLTVGAANLDGSQIMEKLLEVSVTDGWSPGVVGAVVEPEPQREQVDPR